MSDKFKIGRRAFIAATLLAAAKPREAAAQGFAGLGGSSQGFAPVVPGLALEFPRDHGPHKNFRIEWWYVTANLQDASGARYGVQWTLFRQATIAGAEGAGWDNRQLWMGNAAVTSMDRHYFAERLARGGVGQAGADADPFHAWIDSWDVRRGENFSPRTISPLTMAAAGANFEFSLQMIATQPLVLQGDGGYSQKSERGQASYYFSQPFFRARGSIAFDGKPFEVTGQAWMDREWSSQPLASDQTGWDWLSLHLDSGEKVMLFRLRQKDGGNFFAGNWIGADGQSMQLAPQTIEMMPKNFTEIEGRRIPTSWVVAIAGRDLNVDISPLNPKSWMGTRFAYWEGPISFRGSHTGAGYLEMTGY
ncbi:MAG: iron ABC transporter permease [Rhizobiales bacterium]|nr:iron ABC transporter permease [Hyphomicrobiales bacterium]